jgi:multicomponent Na+:H+ antiporter subunit G
MSVLEIIVAAFSWVFIVAGCGFLIVGATGILRFPDFWSRLHAAAVVDSAGAALLLLGMVLQGGFTLVTAKLVLIGVFLFITGPTATHAIANAAYVSHSRPLGHEGGPLITSADIADAQDSTPPPLGDKQSQP